MMPLRLEEQDGKDPYPVPSELLTYKLCLLWRATLPAARALRNWFDENVPDNKDDYTFADPLVMNFLDKAREGGIGAKVLRDYIEILERAGMMLDEAHAKPFFNLLKELVNTQPIWTNNGWPPNELAEARMRNR